MRAALEWIRRHSWPPSGGRHRCTAHPIFPFCPTRSTAAPRAAAKRVIASFDLTVPGLDSAPARELLAHAFGANVRAHVAATNRRHDCTTLYVETDDIDANAVIGKITDWFPNATLGRVIRITRR